MTDDARKSAPHYDLDRVKAGRDLTINHTEHHYPAGAVSNAALLTGRSLYVSQVREFLAPVDGLRGRDHELEELAAFCRGEDPYLWIKAKPWAGKTALLSWFTLYPPQGVTVIGFFITDRLADQNTHTAFTAAIFDQLAVLLPDQRALIASATINRDGLRNELLTLAARHEADRGRRLVLVVDGLDEDTGKPPIVTLLPTRPDPNLRIVVASRHGPTLPISRKHPLITAETRPLRSSPFAADVREQALAELGALLHGSDNHRDLLALITTANGLTASELTDLTGMAPFEIDGLLHAVAGRSLRTRSHYSGPDGTGDPVYVLAHETLQRTAETALGTTYINRCLERLHAWADRYRDLAWPDDTPDFLLRRYFPILDKHNNYPRMTEAALDAARHDRMRTHTGGDVNALAEIRVVQQHICDQSDPDLLTAARLARHRDELHSRYEGISTALPATWARLGQPDRAATIARSISSFWHRADALARIATAIATTHPDRAENIARSITEPQQQAQALARIAGAIATTHPDRGENIARSIEDRWQQAQAHARIARAIAATDPDRAENIAHSITDLSRRVQAFAWIARAIATSDPVRAGQLTDQAEAITNNLAIPQQQAHALTWIARAIATTDPDRAENIAQSIKYPQPQARALAHIASAIATSDPDRAGQLTDQAEAITNNLTDPQQQAHTLAYIAGTIATTDPDRAEAIAHGIADPQQQTHGLGQIASAIATTDPDRAEKIARSIEDPQPQARALADIADSIATTDPIRAGQLLNQAETITHNLIDPWQQDRALAQIASAIATTNPDCAETITHSITNPQQQAHTLADIADSIATTDPIRAGQLVNQAETIAHDLIDPWQQGNAFGRIASAIATTDPDRAETITHSITQPWHRAHALAEIAGAIATTDPLRAGQLTDQAENITHSITDPWQQTHAFAWIAGAIATTDPLRAGQLTDQAENITHNRIAIEQQPEALTHIATAIATTDPDRAETIALNLTDPWRRANAFARIASAIATTSADRAESIACSITQPWHQAQALAEIAGAIATTDPDRAVRLIDQAENITHQLTDPQQQAHVLTVIARAIALTNSDPARTTCGRGKRLLALAWLRSGWVLPISALSTVDRRTLAALAAAAQDDAVRETRGNRWPQDSIGGPIAPNTFAHPNAVTQRSDRTEDAPTP